MSDDIRSYKTLELSLSEAEIERDENLKKLMKANSDVLMLIEKRGLLMEEVRNLRGRLEVMQEIKELAQLYEKAYQAFSFIAGDALENGRDLGINEENIIEVIASALKLYDMILAPVSTIGEIEDQNAYSTFGSNYANDQIPF